MNAADIDAQVGRAQGLWTHTPVDWAGNETAQPTAPAGWPTTASVGVLGIGSGGRPGGQGLPAQGITGTVVISRVSVGSITTTSAQVTFTLSSAPTSSRVNYGTTQGVASNVAGTTATQQTVTIPSLTTKTTYYFSVQATNATGTSVSNLYYFTTL